MAAAVVSSLHLLALALGLPSLFLRGPLDEGGLSGRTLDTSRSCAVYAVNQLQVVLVVAMVFTASLMARGIGLP